jgi:hypothetical protein
VDVAGVGAREEALGFGVQPDEIDVCELAEAVGRQIVAHYVLLAFLDRDHSQVSELKLAVRVLDSIRAAHRYDGLVNLSLGVRQTDDIDSVVIQTLELALVQSDVLLHFRVLCGLGHMVSISRGLVRVLRLVHFFEAGQAPSTVVAIVTYGDHGQVLVREADLPKKLLGGIQGEGVEQLQRVRIVKMDFGVMGLWIEFLGAGKIVSAGTEFQEFALAYVDVFETLELVMEDVVKTDFVDEGGCHVVA